MYLPLSQIEDWISEEEKLGNIFSRGAVLSTITKDRIPTSRMVGTMFDHNKVPKFFTSSNSRKIDDIKANNHISLTYSFQQSLRSISIEGTIVPLTSDELNKDWLFHNNDFRKHYVIFGDTSGNHIESLDKLRKKRDFIDKMDNRIRPESFVGYKFDIINRISFYSVKENDFAVNDVYTFDKAINKWNYSLLVP